MPNTKKEAARGFKNHLSTACKKRIISMTPLNNMTEDQWRTAWRKFWKYKRQ